MLVFSVTQNTWSWGHLLLVKLQYPIANNLAIMLVKKKMEAYKYDGKMSKKVYCMQL